MINEAFLYYIWRYRLYDFQDLKTTKGLPIQVLQVGLRLAESGPDFFNGQIKIDNVLWVGNVEIHVKSSDWERHQHQHDRSYDNVILHVVYEHDREINIPGKHQLPVLELKNLIAPHYINNYQQLQYVTQGKACGSLIQKVNSLVLTNWLDRMAFERLENKGQAIRTLLDKKQQDWEAVTYYLLFKAMGGKVNALPFEMLANSLSPKVLMQCANKLETLEALLFGQAGLLSETFSDSYPQKLQENFRYLKSKYKLQPLAKSQWKFGGLRPAGFPTLRLAQLAVILHQYPNLFHFMLQHTSADALIASLDSVTSSTYWDTHYVFDKTSKHRVKQLGKSALHRIIINAFAPLLFLYGQKRAKLYYQEQALALLETLPAEKNHLLQKWNQPVSIPIKSALHSQAVLQLYQHYCCPMKCLECAVGHEIVRKC